MGAPIQPAEQHEDQLTPVINNDVGEGLPEQPLPDHQPAPQFPQPQPAQLLLMARQTRSGRVV